LDYLSKEFFDFIEILIRKRGYIRSSGMIMKGDDP